MRRAAAAARSGWLGGGGKGAVGWAKAAHHAPSMLERIPHKIEVGGLRLALRDPGECNGHVCAQLLEGCEGGLDKAIALDPRRLARRPRLRTAHTVPDGRWGLVTAGSGG